MRLKYPLYFKKVSSIYAGLAIGENASKFNSVLRLNESGYDIVKHLNEEISREQLIEKVKEEYESSEEEIAASIDKVLEMLRAEGILIE